MNAPTELMPREGVIHGLSIEAYHGDKAAVSKSGLDDVARSPFHYWSTHLDPTRPPEAPRTSDADMAGALLHCALLEPDEFGRRYAIGPDVSRATKEWKSFVADNPGREHIKPGQHAAAMRQADALRALPEVRDALRRGHAEVSAYWRDPQTGVLCRCRPDWVTPVGEGQVILFDAKTYSNASPAEFARQIARMAYHRQAAMYTDGYGIAANASVEAFVFGAVEVEWPHAATAIMLDQASIDQGRREVADLLRIYAKCLATNKWPSYSDSIVQVSLPRWAFDRDE